MRENDGSGLETINNKPKPYESRNIIMTKVIAVVNQKGGVAKTTTTINVGAGLAQHGRNVLLVDLDGQGNLTRGLNCVPKTREKFTIRDAMMLSKNNVLVDPRKGIQTNLIDHVDVMPANVDLLSFEYSIKDDPAAVTLLKSYMNKVRPLYDYSINGDYSYGINKKSSEEEILASMLYVKWLVEESGYSYSEGGLSVYKAGDNPSFYDSLKDCVIMEDAPGVPGEELLFSQLNTESGLLFNANGNAKVQSIVEHAFNGDETFDSIMEEWNKAWSNAQAKLGVEAK